MTQTFLPFQAHSRTSKAAAIAAGPNANMLRLRVLEFISACGSEGATDDEVQIGLEMNPSTQRPRRIELERDGFVSDSGRKRPTRTGRNAVVWIATPK